MIALPVLLCNTKFVGRGMAGWGAGWGAGSYCPTGVLLSNGEGLPAVELEEDDLGGAQLQHTKAIHRVAQQ